MPPSPEPAVNSSPGPSQKRPRLAEEKGKRAARACDGCRRLKEKCEGGIPCQRCNRSGRSCEFNHSSVADHFSANAIDERTKCLEQIATYFLGDISLTLPTLRRVVERIQTKHPKTGIQAVDLANHDLDDLNLEDENFAVKTLSPNTAHYSGEFSHWNFSQKVRRRVDECLQDAVGENVKEKMRIMEYFRATQLQSPASTIFSVVQCLPPRHVTDFLSKIFFQYAQTNFWLVEESWLQSKLELLHRKSADISSNDAGWICAVLMVLAIGTQFAHMASASPKNGLSDDAPSNTRIEHDVGVTFYRMACKLIPDVITIASLESVQACLLLAHYALPLDTQGLAYTYLGLAMKIAIQNGMHRKYKGKDFNGYTVETRNRVWWTTYTVEKRISILHGRPTSISPTDVDTDLPVDIPEFRSITEPSKFANMSASIYLTTRLGDMSHAMALLRRCPKRLQSSYFENILEIRRQVCEWWSHLGLSTTCRDISPTSPEFRPNVHLNICFHLNEIFLGRPFIFFDSKSFSPRAETTEEPTSSSPNTTLPWHRSSNRSLLVSDAINGAIEIIELCRLLHEHNALSKASYIEFSSCRAALLVILAQTLNERREALRNALAVGMKLIKYMASEIDSAKSEASVLAALETGIRWLIGEDKVEEEDAERTVKTGYESFRSWATLFKGGQVLTETSGLSSESPLPSILDADPANVARDGTSSSAKSSWDLLASRARAAAAIDSQWAGSTLEDIFSPFTGTSNDDLLEGWQAEFGRLGAPSGFENEMQLGDGGVLW